MASIVSGLFGLDRLGIQQQIQQEQDAFARTYAQGGIIPTRNYSGAMLGQVLGSAIGNKLFGLQDPRLQKVSKLEAAMQEVNSSLTEQDKANPANVYMRLAERLGQDPDLQNEAMMAQQKAAEIGLTYEQKQAEIDAKKATTAKTNAELAREEQSKIALQAAAQAKGSPLTNEETIQVLSQYLPTDKLVPLLQTSKDKEDYRDAMLQQAQIAADARIAAAESRNASAKELEEIRQGNRIEIKRLEALLNPKGSKATSSVYERGYANQALTSFNELVPAMDNISILTNKGINPLTGSAFSNLKGNSLLGSTGVQLGQILTTSDQAQYESIMKPAIYNIAVLQAGGRIPRQTQIDNLRDSLLSKGGTVQHIAQIQKLGELRQILEKANESYQVNPAASDEQKAMAQEAVNRYKEAIPFTGTDVANFSMFSKKNPNVKFEDWLKVNGSQAGKQVSAGAPKEGDVAKSKSGKDIIFRNGKWEYK